MFRLKACPGCSGDLTLEDDWVCLQCGFRVPVFKLVIRREELARTSGGVKPRVR